MPHSQHDEPDQADRRTRPVHPAEPGRRRHLDQRGERRVGQEVLPPEHVVTRTQDVGQRAGLVGGRAGHQRDALVEQLPFHCHGVGKPVHRVREDHAQRRTDDVQVLRRVDHAAGADVSIYEVHPVHIALDRDAVDRNRVALAQELHHLPLERLLLLHPDRVLAGEPQVHPLLQVLRPEHDLLAHLVRLDVEERRDGGEELAPQVAVLEHREPRVPPVEVERLLDPEVAEVVDGKRVVIRDESDVRRRGAPPGTRWRERQPRGPAASGVHDPREHDRLALPGLHRKRLARHLVALDPGARLDLPQVTEQRTAPLVPHHEVLIHEALQPVDPRLRLMAQALVELVWQEVAERLDVPRTDLQLDHHRVLLDEDLGDGGRQHCPGDDQGVGQHRVGAKEGDHGEDERAAQESHGNDAE